jgi:hypothetical protein
MHGESHIKFFSKLISSLGYTENNLAELFYVKMQRNILYLYFSIGFQIEKIIEKGKKIK